ncbi:MAG: hypothetical protein H6Q10_1723 [Acidobacteria bacterium]|nr:hypothetical protein [Acidobacteriota bacterium]
MTHRFIVAAGLLLLAGHGTAFAQGGGAQALPVRNGRPVVATVNGDAISLDELARQLGPTADRARLRQGRAAPQELELLDRLVTIKLVAQEGATMGLDELPEIRKQVEVSSREILREVLFERLTRGIQPDPAAVEKVFRELSREWKTSSLLFQDQGAAERARKELAGGAAFADVAAKAVAAKAARMDGDDAFHKEGDYLPQIRQALAALKAGQVSPVIRLQAGFAVVKVVSIRHPENAGARAEARQRVLNERQQAVVKAHEEALRRQYATVDTALLKSIDYEAAKPGLDALLKDKRVVAGVKGSGPITVGDLTDYLRMQFFHGTDQAKQRREMNGKKEAALEATLGRRLLNMDAARRGIDKTHEYLDRVKGYQESLVFDAFIQKVIVPESKLREEDARRYYEAHLKDYSYPEMMKLRSVAFGRRAAAEDAMRKLREGADFGWLAANAEGRVPAGTAVLSFDGRPVTVDSMPDGLRKALAGSKAGESRLYADPGGVLYVLAVQEAIAPKARPYDEVREEIAKKAYSEKLTKNIEDYAGKLRAHSKVQTYLKRVR